MEGRSMMLMSPEFLGCIRMALAVVLAIRYIKT